jgi:hypothetical protein
MSLDELISLRLPLSIMGAILLLVYYDLKYECNHTSRIRVSTPPEKDAFDIEAEKEVEQFLKRRTAEQHSIGI